MDSNSLGFVICEAASENTEVSIYAEEDGRVIGEGILQTADEVNRNNRVYSEKDLFPELVSPRVKELLAAKQFKGEAGHPLSKDIVRQQTIDPANTCVRYLKFWTEGSNIKARFKGTNNNLGEAFDKDLREGCKPAFSLRALGTIQNIGGRSYVKNIKIITWDHVIYPSHPHAYTEKLVTESTVSTIEESNDLYANNGKGLLIPITDREIIDYIKIESANLKNVINSFDTTYESYQIINNGKDIQLVDTNNNVFIVKLEAHISDEIMNYCSSFLN